MTQDTAGHGGDIVYYPGICSEGMEEITKNLSYVTHIGAEISKQDLCKLKVNFYSLYCVVRKLRL